MSKPREFTDTHAVNRPAVLHKNVKIDGLEIFYREAGPKDAPTVRIRTNET